jgi:hypothetical protein
MTLPPLAEAALCCIRLDERIAQSRSGRQPAIPFFFPSLRALARPAQARDPMTGDGGAIGHGVAVRRA